MRECCLALRAKAVSLVDPDHTDSALALPRKANTTASKSITITTTADATTANATNTGNSTNKATKTQSDDISSSSNNSSNSVKSESLDTAHDANPQSPATATATATTVGDHDDDDDDAEKSKAAVRLPVGANDCELIDLTDDPMLESKDHADAGATGAVNLLPTAASSIISNRQTPASTESADATGAANVGAITTVATANAAPSSANDSSSSSGYVWVMAPRVEMSDQQAVQYSRVMLEMKRRMKELALWTATARA